MHSYDGNATIVAKLLANSGFKSAYAVKGGAEGQNGWLVSPGGSRFFSIVLLKCTFVENGYSFFSILVIFES